LHCARVRYLSEAERTLRNGFTWRQGRRYIEAPPPRAELSRQARDKVSRGPYRHAQAKRISLAIRSQFEQPRRQECFLRLGPLIFRQIGNGFIQHGFQHQDGLGVENSVAAHNLPTLSLLPHKNSATLKCVCRWGIRPIEEFLSSTARRFCWLFHRWLPIPSDIAGKFFGHRRLRDGLRSPALQQGRSKCQPYPITSWHLWRRKTAN
jgi:hypothetical protein